MSNDFNEWVDRVSSWQDQTKHIPAIAREDIIKARLKPEEAARGLRSLLFDPLSVQYAMGYKDRKYSLTYDMLKRIPHQLAVVGAILQTRCNQVAAFSVPFRNSKSVGFVIKHKDPEHLTTKSEVEFIKDLERFIYNCGHKDPNPYNIHKRDDFESFLKKIVRDSLTFDQLCVEVIPDRRGLPYEFMAVDASSIRIAASNSVYGPNESYHSRSPAYSGKMLAAMEQERGPYRALRLYEGTKPDKRPDFVQILNGQIENVYNRDELVFGVRNPRTDVYIQGYGYGELEQLVTIVTSHLYAEDYNRRFFSQGCVSGDTPVYTDAGIVQINNLVGKSFKTWNGTKFVDSDAVYSGTKVAVVTDLQNDFSITTSPDHKFLSFDEEGNCVFKSILELTSGDYVAQAADCALAFTELKPVQVKKTSHYQLPAEDVGILNSDFYEFIGCLVGDGYISKRKRSKKSNKNHYSVSCVFGPKDKNVLDKFQKLLSEYKFKYQLSKSGGQWGGKPIDRLTIRNQGLFEFLRDTVGMSEKKSHEKTVPTRVFYESIENRCAFIRGLFSADGFIKNNKHALLSSSSRELISGVQHVLWSVGIHSSLSHVLKNASGRNCYYLRVSNNKEFFDKVGFLQPYKMNTKINKQDSVGFVPRALQKSLYKRLYNKDMKENRWLTRRDLFRLAKNNNTEFEALSYRWTRIENIKNTNIEVPVYDIRQVDVGHRWSAGGVITSNSHPKGIFNFKGDSMTPDMLEAFRRQWRTSLEGTENSWRTPILQSEQGIDWIDLTKSNSEMQFSAWMEYLLKITCAVYLIDPAELNFDMHGGVQQTPLFESSQEWKLKASRDRGLKPLLRFIAKMINEHIVSKIDDHFVFDFGGLDELTEQEKHTLRTEQVSSYLTLNEVRRAEDLPDLKYGDIPMSPTYIQAMQVKQQMEQAQQQQQQAAPGGAGAAGSPEQQGQPQGGGGGGEPEDKGNAPDYVDSFGKSVSGSNQKYLEIVLDDWKDDVRSL
jgi:intein/homing endonuclease